MGSMWKGLKKVLGKPGKCKKSSFDKYALDVSNRSTSSAAPSSVLFPLDLDVDAFAAWHEQSVHGQRQAADHAAAEPLSSSQLQQHIQQQLALQKLVQPQDDISVSKRQAAAMQKRIDNAMLNPSTCLYQISSLLSLSTLFEHKLQRDALVALQQTPNSLISRAAAAASAAAGPSSGSQLSCSCGQAASQRSPSSAAGWSGCSFCNPSGLQRTPSATAASTAHVALQLVRWGYRVIVRKVLHSKAYWTKAMDNTFIVALDTSSGSHVEYIVDPHFKETFNVGVMSENYSAVWESLPQVFIGMPCQLQPVVQLLCEEMELSFLEAGRPCPPWREWAATINRWMSDQYVDILVPEPDASDEEVVEYITRCCQFNSTSAAVIGDSSASTATASTADSCSPVALNQQRLMDKMHVSSVLSSTSTCSKRPVHEPLHKQMGFAAVTEDESSVLPSATLRDASFTSMTSEHSAACMQLLSDAQAAAAVAGKRSAISATGGHSLSVPAADIISSSASSISSQGCLAVVADDKLIATDQQQQTHMHTDAGHEHQSRPSAAPDSSLPTADVAATCVGQQAHQLMAPTGASLPRSGCGEGSSSKSSRVSGDSYDGSAAQPRRRKSLLTERMQLKSQLQQSQQRLLLAGFGGNQYVQPLAQPGCLAQLQALQQPQQLQVMQQPQQLQILQQQQQQLQALQQQQQLQALQQFQQHLQQQQQQQLSEQQTAFQQLRVQQQQQEMNAQQLAMGQLIARQQQQLAPLLPVVHTVRPCGADQAPAANVMVPQPQLQQQLCNAQLQVVQAPLQQDQPRLLRLIQRNK